MVVNQTIEQILVELREIKQLLGLGKPILDFTEFCLFANLSEDRVRKLSGEGKLPFTRPFGKKLYITREDAIKVLKQNPLTSQSIIVAKVNDHFLTSKTIA